MPDARRILATMKSILPVVLLAALPFGACTAEGAASEASAPPAADTPVQGTLTELVLDKTP